MHRRVVVIPATMRRVAKTKHRRIRQQLQQQLPSRVVRPKKQITSSQMDVVKLRPKKQITSSQMDVVKLVVIIPPLYRKHPQLQQSLQRVRSTTMKTMMRITTILVTVMMMMMMMMTTTTTTKIRMEPRNHKSWI